MANVKIRDIYNEVAANKFFGWEGTGLNSVTS